MCANALAAMETEGRWCHTSAKTCQRLLNTVMTACNAIPYSCCLTKDSTAHNNKLYELSRGERRPAKGAAPRSRRSAPPATTAEPPARRWLLRKAAGVAGRCGSWAAVRRRLNLLGRAGGGAWCGAAALRKHRGKELLWIPSEGRRGWLDSCFLRWAPGPGGRLANMHLPGAALDLRGI